MERRSGSPGWFGGVAAALLAVILAGRVWGAGWQTTPEPDGSPVTGSPVAATPAAGAVTPVGPQSVSVALAVTIRLTDDGFVPSYVESTDGHPLTITLVNTGTRRHDFQIEHYDIDVDLQPGETRTIVIERPDLGDYVYSSGAPGDEGMVGMLTFYV